MPKPPPKPGSNRTGTKNGPNARKPGPEVRAMDWERISKMAAMQCTIEEICAVEGISREWLTMLCEREHSMKIGPYVESYRYQGRVSLRRAQFKSAIENQNVQMQIWLGKNVLQQSEKIEHYEMPEPLIIQRSNGVEIELGAQYKKIGATSDDDETIIDGEEADGDNR